MKPMITAHSGCCGTVMNSWDYIKTAADLPIAALELDIRRSAQGELLLTHDPIGDAPLLTLREACEYLQDKDILINCDLKEYDLEDDILAMADECGIDRKRLIFTGSVTRAQSFLKTHGDVCVMINPEELIGEFYPRIKAGDTKTVPELLALCRESGYTAINIDFRVLNDEVFRLCTDAGIRISAWTADEETDMRMLCRDGVINITTNRPKLALTVVNVQ